MIYSQYMSKCNVSIQNFKTPNNHFQLFFLYLLFYVNTLKNTVKLTVAKISEFSS